jgi:hypothetical protein
LWGALGTRASKETIERESPDIVDPPRELSEFEKDQLKSKPLQTWTAADGTSTLKARQVDVQRETWLILLTEDGEVRRVPLSSLRSEDAYRAVQQHLAEKLKARMELKGQLERGLAMLDNKQFEEFAEAFMPGAHLDPKAMAKMVQLERGLLIHRFESSLRMLEIPDSPQVRFSESELGAISVQFIGNNRPFTSQLRLIYDSGRWQFSVR